MRVWMAVRGERDEIIECAFAALAGEEVWIEVTYTGAGGMSASGGGCKRCGEGCERAQVLSIRTAAAMLDRQLRANEAETLETLSVQDVFLALSWRTVYLMKSREQTMIDGFNEIVQGLEDAEIMRIEKVVIENLNSSSQVALRSTLCDRAFAPEDCLPSWGRPAREKRR